MPVRLGKAWSIVRRPLKAPARAAPARTSSESSDPPPPPGSSLRFDHAIVREAVGIAEGRLRASRVARPAAAPHTNNALHLVCPSCIEVRRRLHFLASQPLPPGLLGDDERHPAACSPLRARARRRHQRRPRRRRARHGFASRCARCSLLSAAQTEEAVRPDLRKRAMAVFVARRREKLTAWEQTQNRQLGGRRRCGTWIRERGRGRARCGRDAEGHRGAEAPAEATADGDGDGVVRAIVLLLQHIAQYLSDRNCVNDLGDDLDALAAEHPGDGGGPAAATISTPSRGADAELDGGAGPTACPRRADRERRGAAAAAAIGEGGGGSAAGAGGAFGQPAGWRSTRAGASCPSPTTLTRSCSAAAAPAAGARPRSRSCDRARELGLSCELTARVHTRRAVVLEGHGEDDADSRAFVSRGRGAPGGARGLRSYEPQPHVRARSTDRSSHGSA